LGFKAPLTLRRIGRGEPEELSNKNIFYKFKTLKPLLRRGLGRLLL